MKSSLLLLVLLGIGLSAYKPAVSSSQDLPDNILAGLKSKLTFACVHEVTPELPAEADVVFQYARWLQKGNQLKRDTGIDVQIERFYRIAAEHGHYKANINLQNGAVRGVFQIDSDEHLRFSQQLIDVNVASGYYFIGILLGNGSAGLVKDPEMALRYFRKAADTGSAQAQYRVADNLAPINIAPDIARQMRHCAAEQGHGKAAVELGSHFKINGQYKKAIEAFQLGVVAGNSTSASYLKEGFRSPSADDLLHYLELREDLERAERYEKIWRMLANYSYANPKVPEINEIVPLPPAPLPEWDGKLQWLEARLANVPPEKPSEVLIHKLAKEKVLDPATGKPMPGSPVFNQSSSPL